MSETAAVKKKGPKKRRRMSKKKKIFIAVLSLFIALVLAVILFIGGKLGLLGKVSFNREAVFDNGIITGEGYTTVALFGVDSRDVGSLGKGTHSDTMIVLSINNQTKEARMVSLFRDTYLDCAKNGEDYYFKANQAYFQGGPEQAVNMLNKNLDLSIKDFFTVDFKALSTAVDMLGGIDIEITKEEAEWINLYALDVAENTDLTVNPIEEKEGLAHLNGVNATAYARIRYTTGWDYKRAERQRIVISKCLEKAKQADLFTLNNIVDRVLPMCATSFSGTQLLGFARDLTTINMGETAGFPFDKTADIVGSAGDCVIAEGLAENVTQLHEFLYDEKNYQPSETVKKIAAKITADTGVKAKKKEAESSSSENKKKATGSSASSKGN